MFKIIIGSDYSRKRAIEAVVAAEPGHVMTLAEPRRTNAQNDLLWELLTQVSQAKPMGRDHSPEIWKCIFMDALPDAAFKARWVPSLDGESVVNTGHRSSKLTKAQMSDLIESINAFIAENGIDDLGHPPLREDMG
jgi:hypothetical protein